MGRKDAGRRFVECAERDVCADGADDADGAGRTAMAKATWILPQTPQETDVSAPIAGEVLAEIDCKINALSGQLDALAALTRNGVASGDRELDYLLEQFRILTFTIGGTMSRQIMTEARGAPVGLLQSVLATFVVLADRLCAAAGRCGRRDDRVHEIQRQSRSVSQKMAIVIDQLGGSRANDLLDDLETILIEFETVANQPDSATGDQVSRLSQPLCQKLAQFEEAVEETNQYVVCSERFQRLAERGFAALDRLLEQPGGEHQAETMRLHILFSFAASQFVIRANNAAIPPRTVS